MVQAEVERVVAPMMSALQQQGEVLSRFAAAFGSPLKRGPGRPRKAAFAGAPVNVKRGPGRPRGSGGDVRCAIIDCKRPARAKGYCAAHYQKYRNLAKTGRLPADWVENATPQSVKNLVLPRGRAGAKALAESRKKKR
jgi:hypothetical protein